MNQDGVYQSPQGGSVDPEAEAPGPPAHSDESHSVESHNFELHSFELHARTTSQLGKEPECREALNRLYHFLDGELTEKRRHEIQDHLDTCLPCLEAFDFEAELKLLIATRCRDEVPAQLRVRVAVALSEASMTSVAPKEHRTPPRRSDH